MGRRPGAEGSIGDVALRNVSRQAAKVRNMMGGAARFLAPTEPHESFSALLSEVLVSVPAQSNVGGTDEIQRSILGEKVLGLRRRPDPTEDHPYREVRNL